MERWVAEAVSARWDPLNRDISLTRWFLAIWRIKGFELTPEERLEKFCYAGDDRNILERFLDGKKVVLD